MNPRSAAVLRAVDPESKEHRLENASGAENRLDVGPRCACLDRRAFEPSTTNQTWGEGRLRHLVGVTRKWLPDLAEFRTVVMDRTPFQAGYAPRCARSMVATSILRISIMASNTRFAAARSGSFIPRVSATGVICQDTPHLSLHQPQALS